MTQPAPTRFVDGIQLPGTGLWRIDSGHAEISFIGRHFMLTKVRGRFTEVAGQVHVTDRPEESSVTATIGMASVNSGNESRDDHLKSPDLFDVEKFPEAKFASTQINWSRSRGEITGDLTIKGVTRPVTLTVSYLGHARDPWDNDRAAFEASGHIDREDWGITWNMLLESGGMMVSKEIELEIHIELVLNS